MTAQNPTRFVSCRTDKKPIDPLDFYRCKILLFKGFSVLSKITLALTLALLCACGGSPQIQIYKGPPTPANIPPTTPPPSPITAAQVFDASMIGQTWTFQNAYGDKTFIQIEAAQMCEFGNCDGKSVIWHFTKNNPRAYWDPGVADADLLFILHNDPDGAWSCIGFKWTASGALRSAAITLLSGWSGTPYVIIPSGSDSPAVNTAYQSRWNFGYSDDPIPAPGTGSWTSVWTTYAYLQPTFTPLTGTVNSLMSRQCEGGHSGACDGVWENWHFCPGVGLCAVEPIANYDDSGNRIVIDPNLVMVRVAN